MFARSRTYLINIIPNQNLDPEEAGTEASQLGVLASSGVDMPDSFVVTGTAFDDFITSNDLVDQVSELISQVDPDDPSTAVATSMEIERMILGANLPSVVLNPVIHAYRQMSGFTDKYVTIKPSWILSPELVPDSDDFNFENIKGEGALIYHLKKAWTALFSPEALIRRAEYRYQGGISISVVIQKMIQSEVSGIAFSADPITMDDDYIQIEAMLGLLPIPFPPNLNPDVYKIEREDLHIAEKNIMEQPVMYLRKGRAKDDEHPVIEVDISSEWRRKQKIEDNIITHIAQIVQHLEEHYNHPVEIFWSYESGKVYVTQLKQLTKFEVPESNLSQKLINSNSELELIAAEATAEIASQSMDFDRLAQEVNDLIDQRSLDDPMITDELGIEYGHEDIPDVEEVVSDIIQDLSLSPNQPIPVIKDSVAPIPDTQETVQVPQVSEIQETVQVPEIADPQPDVQLPDTGSILDKLPPELRSKIEEAAAQAPEEIEEEEPEEIAEPENIQPETSILDEVEIEESEVQEIVVTKPISQTYKLNTPVYLDMSAVDTGTLANAANFDGGFLDGTQMILRHKILPESLSNNQNDLKKLIEAYALEISTAAKALNGLPVIYSFSDINDTHRAELLGEVPNQAGLDGSERFVLKPEALLAEMTAVKRAKTVYGAQNISVLMPKLRTEIEIIEMKKIMNTLNFRRTSTTMLYAEVATPSFLYELEHTETSDIDGVIINFNKLAQGMTGRAEFVARDQKPILSAIKLMLDYNRSKKLNFFLKMTDNPELVEAAFQARIFPNGFIFSGIPSSKTFEVIQRFELAPLKKSGKRGRKPKELT